jgi:hypothetical protein
VENYFRKRNRHKSSHGTFFYGNKIKKVGADASEIENKHKMYVKIEEKQSQH